MLLFSLISCVYSCAHAHGYNKLAGEWVYHVWDIFREFLGHNFVSGLRTLQPKNVKKPKNLNTFSKNLRFSSPDFNDVETILILMFLIDTKPRYVILSFAQMYNNRLPLTTFKCVRFYLKIRKNEQK